MGVARQSVFNPKISILWIELINLWWPMALQAPAWTSQVTIKCQHWYCYCWTPRSSSLHCLSCFLYERKVLSGHSKGVLTLWAWWGSYIKRRKSTQGQRRAKTSRRGCPHRGTKQPPRMSIASNSGSWTWSYGSIFLSFFQLKVRLPKTAERGVLVCAYSLSKLSCLGRMRSW